MPTFLEMSRRFTEKTINGGTPMRQVKNSPRIRAYTAETIAEALRLQQGGITKTKIARRLGIPSGSISRILRVAVQGHESVRIAESKYVAVRARQSAKSQEPTGEQPPPEELQMPKAQAAFFDWLVKRAYAAEAELLETQKLLADKSAEALRAWAELNALVKTDVSRQLSEVYQEYTSASRSSSKGGQ
jgi:transposase-like protein